MTDAVVTPPPAKPAGAFSSWEIGLALRYLRAKRKEGGVALIAIISFIGIMLAVAVLISVMSIMAGFRSELLGRMLSFNGHMFVQGEVLASPDRDAVIDRLRTLPGVVSVSPFTENQAIYQANGVTTGGIVRGLRADDLDTMQYVAASLSPEARAAYGRGEYGGDGVLIGESLAASMGLRVGDQITIFSPTGATSAFGNLGGLNKAYTIAGTYTSGTADFDQVFIFMPLEQAQLFFGKESLWDAIELKLRNPDEVGQMTEAVREAAGQGALVTDWRAKLAAFYGALQVERVAMSVILGMVVAIAAMNIISGIVMLVKNKGKDIAILRTIGASPGSILRVFFLAGATIGVAGTLAGLILGLLFCLNIGSIQHFLEAITGVQLFNSDVYMLDAIPALVDPVDVFWVAVWSLGMSCVASLPPSWNASRIDPVEALRYE